MLKHSEHIWLKNNALSIFLFHQNFLGIPLYSVTINVTSLLHIFSDFYAFALVD